MVRNTGGICRPLLEMSNSRMWSALQCCRNIGGTEYFQLTNKSQEKCACIDFMYNNKDNLFVCNDVFVSFLQDMLGYDLNEKVVVHMPTRDQSHAKSYKC